MCLYIVRIVMNSSWGTGRSGKHSEGQVRKVSAPKPEWQVTVKVTTSLGVDYTYEPCGAFTVYEATEKVEEWSHLRGLYAATLETSL